MQKDLYGSSNLVALDTEEIKGSRGSKMRLEQLCNYLVLLLKGTCVACENQVSLRSPDLTLVLRSVPERLQYVQNIKILKDMFILRFKYLVWKGDI